LSPIPSKEDPNPHSHHHVNNKAAKHSHGTNDERGQNGKQNQVSKKYGMVRLFKELAFALLEKKSF
jgi:hypothetical protein